MEAGIRPVSTPCSEPSKKRCSNIPIIGMGVWSEAVVQIFRTNSVSHERHFSKATAPTTGPRHSDLLAQVDGGAVVNR
jgi:hypothetical protein